MGVKLETKYTFTCDVCGQEKDRDSIVNRDGEYVRIPTGKNIETEVDDMPQYAELMLVLDISLATKGTPAETPCICRACTIKLLEEYLANEKA